MLIFFILSSILLHIRIKFCIIFFMYYLLPTIKKEKKDSNPYSNFYIYYLRIYMIKLMFSFYESLQNQC